MKRHNYVVVVDNALIFLLYLKVFLYCVFLRADTKAEEQRGLGSLKIKKSIDAYDED